MCGIEVIVKRQNVTHEHANDVRDVARNVRNVAHRGPDQTCTWSSNLITMMFHRLAIQDTSRAGDQPFRRGSALCVSNGELYNASDLIASYELPVHSQCDMEVWLPLLEQLGSVDAVCRVVDGMFATVLITDSHVYLTRDRIGVKPLFYHLNEGRLNVASEPIALEHLGGHATIEVKPGTLLTLDRTTWTLSETVWATWPSIVHCSVPTVFLRNALERAVARRVHADRPIGCFLSGGLDSSIVAALVSQHISPLHTFSIGWHPDSPDLVYARRMAAHIGSIHHELIVSADKALEAVPRVIRAIGSYDTTTVRASTPMFLLSEFIKTTDIRVVFSGEGSDELLGGYLYFHKAPSDEAFEAETLRLTQDLYLYDVLRADRCTAHFGLEFREPFLDTEVVNLCLSLAGAIRRGPVEKQVLRQAFESILPPEIAWRQKAAFSDAVSEPGDNWFRIIQRHAASLLLTEAQWYQTLYAQSYAYDPCRPLWMPRWVDVDDPSATVLP